MRYNAFYAVLIFKELLVNAHFLAWVFKDRKSAPSRTESFLGENWTSALSGRLNNLFH